MNRRGFIGTLAGLAAGMTLDSERLLWRPGEKVISIPNRVRRYLLEGYGQTIYPCYPGNNGLSPSLVYYVSTEVNGVPTRVDIHKLHMSLPSFSSVNVSRVFAEMPDLHLPVKQMWENPEISRLGAIAEARFHD